MKQFLFSFAALLLAGAPAMYAQVIATPPVGTIDAEKFPMGVASVEIDSFGGSALSVNRECIEFATLSRNGEVIRQVPAANYEDVYCFEGFDKVDVGGAHITFFQPDYYGPANAKGSYEVYVPKGFFFRSGSGGMTECPEITLKYGITASNSSEPFVFSVLPGSTVNGELKEFTISVPEGYTIQHKTKIQSESAANVKFIPAGTDLYSPCYDSSAAFVPEFEEKDPDRNIFTNEKYSIVVCKDNVATCTFSEPLTLSGRFSIRIAKNVFIATDPDGNKYYLEAPAMGGNAKIEYNATLAGATYDTAIAPAEGEVESFSTIFPFTTVVSQWSSTEGKMVNVDTPLYGMFRLGLGEGASVGMILASKASLVQLDDQDKEIASSKVEFQAKKNPKDESHVYFVKVGSTGDETLALPSGNYLFKIPKQMYQVKTAAGTSYNVEQTYRYILLGAPEKAYVDVIPATTAPVSQLNRVEVVYPEGSELKVKPTAYASLDNGMAEYKIRPVVEDNKVIVTFPAAVTVKGEWALSIPFGDVTVNGKASYVSETYVITPDNENTGVASVEAPATVTVYNISGICVARDADPAVLSTLPAGLYIVNGAKLLIR